MYTTLRLHKWTCPLFAFAMVLHPIQRAIAAGDTRTGMSAMRMEAGLDTGPVIGTLDCEISVMKPLVPCMISFLY